MRKLLRFVASPVVKGFLNVVLIAIPFASLAHGQTTGHIDVSSEKCSTADAVYVYSTPYAKTQKSLGFLEDGAKVDIILTPRVAGYYFVEGYDAGGERLYGYVEKSCVVIAPVEEPERREPPPPTLRSGIIRVFPLSLGDTFEVTIGGTTGTCTTKSTKDLECPTPLPNFQAVIASQGRHEFLLGCQSVDSDTCVNLGVGLYSIIVHDRTVTVLHSGWATINTKTGKKLGDITPVLSVLGLVK